VTGTTEGGVVGDEALTVEVVQAVVHQGHALFAAGLDRVFQLMDLIFANQIS